MIEDSAQGIQSAKRAGMKTLALAHSVKTEELGEADCILSSLEDVSLGQVEALFEVRQP